MRILHTADWHLGDRLGRIDRTDDLRKAVERVADLCRQERVDVLLIAGDLFSELARPDSLREAIRHWQDVFHEFLQTGGTILALTGNHDNETFCQTLVHAMTLAAPAVPQSGATVTPGRLYLATEPTLIRLPDREQSHEVQFVLMPYPTAYRYLSGGAGQKYGSPDEKNQLLVAAWAAALADLRGHPNFDPKAPSVLGAHVHLRGSQIGSSLFRMTEQEDVVVEGGGLAEQFDYVALGHIHKPQSVGVPHIRYCGSIEKMDLGEQADQKGAILLDLGENGLRDEPSTLPLPSSPIYEIVVMNPVEDLPRLRRDYADAAADLVNLHIHYTAGVDHLEQVMKELEEIFPRWYARDWTESGSLGPTLVSSDSPAAKGFGETVRDYLRLELDNHSEEEREAILALANRLLEEMEK
jgi:exonuclease SbcD